MIDDDDDGFRTFQATTTKLALATGLSTDGWMETGNLWTHSIAKLNGRVIGEFCGNCCR